MRGIFPNVTTTRGIQNRRYATRAAAVIRDDAACRWLYDASTQTIRASILAELGRLETDEQILRLGRQICELKPTAREAIAMLRAARLGRSAPSDATDLANRLIGTLNAYRRSHPTCGPAQMIAALDMAIGSVASLDG